MKKGVAIWNYGGSELEHAEAFRRLGCDAVSWHGKTYGELTDGAYAELAEFISKSGMALTVHYKLPNPEDAAECADFLEKIRLMAERQAKTPILAGLTFDAWYGKKAMMPYLSEAIAAFRGSGVFLACEDFPLNARELELVSPLLAPGDNYGLLIDLGHMNLRQTRAVRHAPEDFISAFEEMPLPIREVHLHDNNGEKDDHMYLGFGTLPLQAAARGLKTAGFDGIVTVEIIQRDWGFERGLEYVKSTSDAFFTAFSNV
jgi:sugar phosphate isomerase/epimerase